MGTNRRTFLAAGLGSLAATRTAAAFGTWKQARFSSYPFSLGVASGDPSADGVVLWSRLAPDPLNGGGMPAENVEVQWRVAADERMTNIVQQGTTVASPSMAHSVHVEVGGLEADRWYWYQFQVGPELSPRGRTRTAPAVGAAVDKVNFAFVSCQHYETGYFTGFRHLVAEDLSLVIHLGDYIYEGAGRDGRVRKHNGGEIVSLDDYRNRYALYKTDSNLQAAHASFPWAVTWDDHEVDNNYAAEISEKEDPVDLFLKRRASAYQAYYEHMPLRRSSLPDGPGMQLYRSLTFGDLFKVFILDTRQYRTDQPCGDGSKPICEGVHDPQAALLGARQEQWLYEGLGRSNSRWNVLAQQVMMAHVDRLPGPDETYSMDKWSGYAQERDRVLGYLAQRPSSNTVVLTGDIHSNWVSDLKADFADTRSATVGAEFVGTSISSSGDGVDSPRGAESVLSENPFLKFLNAQRGYVSCSVTPERWTADYRVLEYVTRPGSPISTRASFVVEDNRPGVKPA